jgi:hypothetical protein
MHFVFLGNLKLNNKDLLTVDIVTKLKHEIRQIFAHFQMNAGTKS